MANKLRRVARTDSKKGSKAEENFKNLKEQYEIIRDDVLKLRTDLQKGYDMARGMIDKKSLLKELRRTK